MINPKRKKGPPKKTGTVEKRMFTCLDGPLKDHALCLESGGTLPLNIKGEVGRYIHKGTTDLVWQPEQTQ